MGGFQAGYSVEDSGDDATTDMTAIGGVTQCQLVVDQ